MIHVMYMKNICLLKVLVFCFLLLPVAVIGQEQEDSGYTLKVLCYNLRFGELASLEQLAEYIRSENPDVVALQEVDVRTNRGMAPHQNGKDFITELGFRTGMLTAYARTIDFSGGYYGIGILSKYPFEQTRKVMLPIPDGSNEQRAVLLADVELPGGRAFTFACTHLDHSSSAVRTIQVQALDEVLKSNRLPLIIAGDFNARPDSPEIKNGMKDYLQACTDDFTFSSSDPKSKIDYIFCYPAAAWKKVEATTPHQSLSDHLPVTAVVQLN
jgi:endonuclease/exonuclease/phosphatase family metal-dependent hydrolase